MAYRAEIENVIAVSYSRLSDEDRTKEKSGDLSVSIRNQKEILAEYCRQKGWGLPAEFYDDDTSGTGFDRSGFQAMYNFVTSDKSKKFVIVIKNVDRFGRNYIKSGLYFEKLADMGVRIIFTDNGIDTDNPQTLMGLPYLFIGAETYSQTLSTKIKSVRRHQWSKGMYLATYEPYGYLKSAEDKHKLIIDNGGSAEVVKRIFEMRLNGLSAKIISDKLNGEGILSPSAYWRERVQREDENKPKELRRKLNRFGADFWGKDTVGSILSNFVYVGDVVNNKKPRISYKNHHIDRKDPSEWVISPNMHEPLVSREDFEKVRSMKEKMGRVRSTQTKEIMPFSGVLRCPDCALAMTQTASYRTLKDGTRKKFTSYNCNGYGRSHLQCTNHYISEKDLTNIVLNDIKEKSAAIAQNEELMRKRFNALKTKTNCEKSKNAKKFLKKAEKRLKDLELLIKSAFERSVLGGNGAETFNNLEQQYRAEQSELRRQITTLKQEMEQQKQTENDVDSFIKLMKKHVGIETLDRAAVVQLIEKITVSKKPDKLDKSGESGNPREVVIYYNLIGNI